MTVTTDSMNAQFGYYVTAACVFFIGTILTPAIPIVMGYPTWISVPPLVVGAVYTALHIRAAYRAITKGV